MVLLIVDEPSVIRKSGRRIVVESRVNRNKKEVSVYDLDAMLILKRSSLSTDVIRLVCSYGKFILIGDREHEFAVIHPFIPHGTVVIRREQMKAFDDERGSYLAKMFVYATCMNKARLLKYFAKGRSDYVADLLKERAEAIENRASHIRELEGFLDDIRRSLLGIEGDCAYLYFDAIAKILPKELGFRGREKRPPRDPVNSCLSFGYILLYGQILIKIVSNGLEPYAGFLHTDRSGRPSLVCDLCEEFRQPVVDKIVYPLFTRRILKKNDFQREKSRVIMSKKALRIFLSAFMQRLDSQVRYDKCKRTFRTLITHQTRKLVRFLLRRIDRYEPYVWGWWHEEG